MSLIEANYPVFRDYIMNRQQQFFVGMMQSRNHMNDDPFMFCVNMVLKTKSCASRYIKELLSKPTGYFSTDNSICRLRCAIETQAELSYKRKFYLYVNQTCIVHPVYDMFSIPEYKRVHFTRLRISAHNLMIEKGRWSRLPRERRLCECGEIQTEEHVIKDCTLINHIRNRYSLMYKLPDCFLCNTRDVIDFCYDICTFFSDM